MVRDSISDGKRIGQLLASEMTGLERGALSGVELVDVDESAEPSPGGTRAYGLARDGRQFGTVYLVPEAVEVHLRHPDPAESQTSDPFVDSSTSAVETDAETVLRVESGAAVKRAVDGIRTVLTAER